MIAYLVVFLCLFFAPVRNACSDPAYPYMDQLNSVGCSAECPSHSTLDTNTNTCICDSGYSWGLIIRGCLQPITCEWYSIDQTSCTTSSPYNGWSNLVGATKYSHCLSGYKISMNGRSCENTCPTYAVSFEVPGQPYFACQCMTGYFLNVGRTDCVDSCETGQIPKDGICTVPPIDEDTIYQPSNGTKVAKDINQVNKVANEVMSGVSAFIFQGVHSIRSQSVQSPLNFLIFMNIDYPPNYVYSTGWISNDTEQTTRLLQDETIMDANDVTNFDKYLEDQDFLDNLKFPLIYILVSIIAIVLVEALAILYPEKTETPSKLSDKLKQKAAVAIKKGSKSLRWSFLINQLVSKYQEIAFFSFLGIYNAAKKSADINLAWSLLGTIFVTFWLSGLFLLIKRIFTQLQTNNKGQAEKPEKTEEPGFTDYLERRLVLHKELEKDRLMQLLYPFFLASRILGFSITIIFLNKVTYLQLAYLNLSTFLMIIYLIKFKPLEDKNQLWMTLAYEFDFLIAIFGATILHISNQTEGTNENTRTALGYLIMAANNLVLLLNVTSIILENWERILQVVEKIKQRRKGSSVAKVSNEPSHKMHPNRQGGFHPIQDCGMSEMKVLKEEEMALSIDTPSNYKTPFSPKFQHISPDTNLPNTPLSGSPMGRTPHRINSEQLGFSS